MTESFLIPLRIKYKNTTGANGNSHWSDGDDKKWFYLFKITAWGVFGTHPPLKYATINNVSP